MNHLHSRREFLASSSLLLLAAATGGTAASGVPPETEPIIDIHQHTNYSFRTDEQLLALFPKTPVGLAKLGNGKKMLIFPRPADEARYVVHL